MSKKIKALLLLVAVSSIAQNGWAGSKRAGDVVAVTLPVAALGVTALESDLKPGGYQLFTSLAATAALTFGLNEVIDKKSPDGESGAFPSGHTSISFASAGYLQRRYGWQYGIPAYLAASYVGWSRVDSDQHDSWDVIGGAVLGVGCSYLLTDRKVELAVGPLQDSQGRIAGVQVSTPWQ
jgi:membrane-associated phospholipid phosphatase